MVYAGMSYPGADVSIKKHLWATICQPTLLYGMECVELSKTILSQLETIQSNHIEQSLGLNRSARSSYILDSLQLPRVKSVLSKKCSTFYHSIFQNDTPTAELNYILLARYVASGQLIEGTLIHKIVNFGLSPISVALSGTNNNIINHITPCGIIDSIQSFLSYEFH